MVSEYVHAQQRNDENVMIAACVAAFLASLERCIVIGHLVYCMILTRNFTINHATMHAWKWQSDAMDQSLQVKQVQHMCSVALHGIPEQIP